MSSTIMTLSVYIFSYITVYYLIHICFFFLMIRPPPRSTLSSSSAASDVYKRQLLILLPSLFSFPSLPSPLTQYPFYFPNPAFNNPLISNYSFLKPIAVLFLKVSPHFSITLFEPSHTEEGVISLEKGY
eukprot:TRINITY_DN11260_c0_g1_i1.p1 TRINITY_DN11260_c0_g1~~TRINITY_DN11260_c0_g1_i1.p1  ORF type:complete len:129 (+),score=1.07 TRINITY_DN11260_c0_g1_i1:2-388(+)